MGKGTQDHWGVTKLCRRSEFWIFLFLGKATLPFHGRELLGTCLPEDWLGLLVCDMEDDECWLLSICWVIQVPSDWQWYPGFWTCLFIPIRVNSYCGMVFHLRALFVLHLRQGLHHVLCIFWPKEECVLIWVTGREMALGYKLVVISLLPEHRPSAIESSLQRSWYKQCVLRSLLLLRLLILPCLVLHVTLNPCSVVSSTPL